MYKKVWEYVKEVWPESYCVYDKNGRKICEISWGVSSGAPGIEDFLVRFKEDEMMIYVPCEAGAEFSQLQLTLTDESSFHEAYERPDPQELLDIPLDIACGKFTVAEGWSRLERFIKEMIEYHKQQIRFYQRRAFAHELRNWLILEIKEEEELI